MNIKLNEHSAEILLMLVISARATSFLFSKTCLQTMTTFSLLAIRFLTASALMFLIFHRRLFRAFHRMDALRGMVFGVLFFLVLFCEHSGLKAVTSSTASFLENMAIVLVPLAEGVLARKLPARIHLIRALTAVCGVFFLTVGPGIRSLTCSAAGNDSLSQAASGSVFPVHGYLFLLAAAALYTAAIIVTNRLSRKGDAFTMGFFQILTIGILGAVSTGVSGEFTPPAGSTEWLMILALAVVCTGFGFTLQPVAQSFISSEKAGLFCALSPLVAGILGTIVMHDPVTVYSLLGEGLILFSLVMREKKPHKSTRHLRKVPDTTRKYQTTI